MEIKLTFPVKMSDDEMMMMMMMAMAMVMMAMVMMMMMVMLLEEDRSKERKYIGSIPSTKRGKDSGNFIYIYSLYI